MARKRDPDNLDKDSARATAAGLSYGQWKPFFPHTKDDNILPPPPNTKPCEICGTPMRKGGRVKKFCCEECAYIARKMRNKEYRQRQKAKKKKEEA